MVHAVSAKFIDKFLQKHQLPSTVKHTLKVWFEPIAEQLALHQNKAKQPIIIGINGSQGSGKTTLTDFLTHYFYAYYGLRVVSFSLDDYYLSHSERNTLSKDIHPLLATRGVPGTHKIEQLYQDIQTMLSVPFKGPVFIPRFDKATDNPFKTERWSKVTEQPDIIIMEGWCCGLNAQTDAELVEPVNALEREQDSQGAWRQYVNHQLAKQYKAVFDCVDRWIMLKAPSFEVVSHWRYEQERKLAARTKFSDNAVMSEQQINQFVMYFERLTRHAIANFETHADICLHLNSTRQITHATGTYKALCYPQKLAVFSDLDGTLLDHCSYDFQAAKPSIFLCHELGFPIIPTTSKTFKELIPLNNQLGLGGPFIIENGAAIFMPKQWLKYHVCSVEGLVDFGNFYIKEFGQPRQHWLDLIEQTTADLSDFFLGFSAMTAEQLAELTGLTVKQAEKAKTRHYSEPIHWLGDDIQKQLFIERLRAQGAHVVAGGRFLHVSGVESKGMAIEWLSQFIRNEIAGDWITVALGDGENDISMLERADIAVQIKSVTHPFYNLQRIGPTIRSTEPGPVGWHQSMMNLISDLDNHRLDKIKTNLTSSKEEKEHG